MRKTIIALIVASLVLISSPADAKKRKPKKLKKITSITYTLQGPASASITSSSGGTDVQQDTQAALPWTRTIPAKRGFAVLYQVIGQNNTDQPDPITCTITVNGTKVVKVVTSSGPYAIAHCTWAQPRNMKIR